MGVGGEGRARGRREVGRVVEGVASLCTSLGVEVLYSRPYSASPRIGTRGERKESFEFCSTSREHP